MKPASGQLRDFQRVFREQAPFVWRVLRRHGVREGDLEDACQEVFLVLHRRAADFRGEGHVRTWLYGIAMRVAANQRRRAHLRREHCPERLPTQVIEADQLRAVERREAQTLLLRALNTLSPAKREVFVLFEIEDWPMAEIARALGCPLNTAYARLGAARRAIEQHVRRECARQRVPAATTREESSP